MNDIRLLVRMLADNLSSHKARIKFVAAFLLALVAVKNVNLVEVACAFAGRAKPDSNYKRLQRFFRFFDLPYAEIAECVAGLLGVAGPWTLAIDRTNWKFGKTDLNILMLAIVHQGVAYPLIWQVLPVTGNSHTVERIALLEIFIELFGKERLGCLLGDREFIGKDWLRWLRREQINFHLRVRENFRVTNARGQVVAVKRLFRTRVDEVPEHRRTTPDVGRGVVLQRLLSRQRRVSDPSLPKLQRRSSRGICKALGSRDFVRGHEDARLQS
jgi:Transposase DDE domain